MFVELIESLRCPRDHEECQLVASATRTDARHIVEGVLGCPVCGAEYPITAGVLRIDDSAMRPAPMPADGELAMRAAAFLELTDARGFAVLCGEWGAHVDLIHRLSETRIVLVNPPENVPADVAAGIILSAEHMPLAAGSARAVALHALASDSFARSAVRAVRSKGRVLAPVAVALPVGVTEIARDHRMWVGEKTAAADEGGPPRLVELRKAGR